jgi:hypothetical protein
MKVCYKSKAKIIVHRGLKPLLAQAAFGSVWALLRPA